MDANNSGKKRTAFTILPGQQPGQQKGHATAFRGVLNLNSLAPVIIDGEEIYVDLGAMHAKSQVEKRVKWVAQEEVPNGKEYWIIWVSISTEGEHPSYHGITASWMLIDHEAHRGYKNLAEHVNRMDKALKGQFLLEELRPQEKQLLARFLQEHNQTYWENSPEQLKSLLS